MQTINKRNIDDLMDDEEDMAEDDEEGGDDDNDDPGPPRQRRRLQESLDDDYTPTTPPTSPQNVDMSDPPLLPQPRPEWPDSLEDLDFAEPPPNSPHVVPDSEEDEGLRTTTEPSGEPSAPPTVPVSPVDKSNDDALRVLQPEYFGISGPESFHQKRLRFDQQETISFGPVRRLSRTTTGVEPYEDRREQERLVGPSSTATGSNTLPPDGSDDKPQQPEGRRSRRS